MQLLSLKLTCTVLRSRADTRAQGTLKRPSVSSHSRTPGWGLCANKSHKQRSSDSYTHDI